MDTEDAYLALDVVCILVAIVLLIPPEYDPAIRLREWLERNDARDDP